VCGHRGVKAINAALVGGEAKRAIAKRFPPLTHHALERHADAHIPKLIAKATAADVAHVDEILRQIGELVVEAREVLKAAKADKQWAAATGAIGAAGRLLELILRARGDMQDNAGQGATYIAVYQTIARYVPAADHHQLAVELHAIGESDAA